MCKTFLIYFYVSRHLIFFCLANFRSKLLLCRLTLRWGEMILIDQFFLVGSLGLFVPCLFKKSIEKSRASGTRLFSKSPGCTVRLKEV